MYNEEPKNEVLQIIFKSREEIIHFVDVCNKYDDAIDVRVNKKSTDAKSIMGMLLMKVGEPLTIEYGCYDDEDNYKEFRKEIMEQFQVTAVPVKKAAEE